MPLDQRREDPGVDCVSVYVLVAILKRELKLDRSLTEILQILSVTPFEKTLFFRHFRRFPHHIPTALAVTNYRYSTYNRTST